MKIHTVILLLFTLLQINCDDNTRVNQKETRFIIDNSTENTLEGILVFSTSINNLLPHSESKPQVFSFETLEDDPIVSFKTKNSSFVKYLFPDSSKQLNRIVVDSLNFQTLNVHLHIE
ncbi:MAG: hypothetical protein AAGA64_14315 [Bacteroidota bacterium]